MIEHFRGRWAFLSNFFPSVLTWEGITYPSGEHAFNAGKTVIRGERIAVANAVSPLIAKRLGRRVITLRPEWDTRHRYDVMAAVLRAKFTCHPLRVEALLSTGDHYLIEGNTWHDQHWGDCNCGLRIKCAAPGQNHLGRMLMELRAELANS